MATGLFSGFINEAMDYLSSLSRLGRLGASQQAPIDLVLTGLYGDCAGLTQTMTAAHASLLSGLRAVDTRAAGDDGGSSGNCMMAKSKDGSNEYVWVCDRDSGPAAEAPVKSVALRTERVAIEHGLVCALRKRGFFDDGGTTNTPGIMPGTVDVPENSAGPVTYEDNYGPRPDVFVARCMSESSEISKKVLVLCAPPAFFSLSFLLPTPRAPARSAQGRRLPKACPTR